MKRPSTETSSSLDSDQPPRQLRLMIHAIDGCIPFLTPDILENHFPPSDDFWIGMAVRDTCVLPILPDHDRKSSSTRDTTTEGRLQEETDGTNGKRKQRKDNKKPRGYTFVPVSPDPWLIPYTRFTVPSFNWMEDDARTKEKWGQRLQPGSTTSNDHILIWTPHGRQKLTPELYAQATIGLQSSFTLSLYDMHEENCMKRIRKADVRNRLWFDHLLHQRQDETGTDDSLWSPLLLPKGDGTDIVLSHDNHDDVTGVALIGNWRSDLELSLKDRLEGIPHVAMLTTSSLSEILDIISSNIVDTIGTDLPNLWAQRKWALAIDFSSSSSTSSTTNNKKKSKREDDSDSHCILNKDGCIDLSDPVFADDPMPLVVGCECMGCADPSRFSRAYVHHLICAKEVLVDIILFAHNLHQLLEMIRAFNTCDNRDDMLNSIRAQLDLGENTQQ